MNIYKNITILSRDEHKTLKLNPMKGYAMAANIHWVPLAGTELALASHHYPVVFVSEMQHGKESVTPIALLGLKPGRNDFVAKDGSWFEHAYVPAFVRRYPFILASIPGDDPAPALCFDSAYPGFNKKSGKALFSRSGENSAWLNEVIAFMNGFNIEKRRTLEFTALLKKYDLLQNRTINIRNCDDVTFQVRDFLSINEEKLAALSADKLVTLNQSGYLGWIFAHIGSLTNLPKLLDLHLTNNSAD